MNRTEFLAYLKDEFDIIAGLSKTKGTEYAGYENAFRNFEELAKDLHIEREKILWIYFSKHLSSIRRHISSEQKSSEPITGRIDDAILYLILLRAMLEESTLQGRGGLPEGTHCQVSGVRLDNKSDRGPEQCGVQRLHPEREGDHRSDGGKIPTCFVPGASPGTLD